MKFLMIIAVTALALQASAKTLTNPLPMKGNYNCTSDRAYTGGQVVVSTTDAFRISLGTVADGSPLAYVMNAEKPNTRTQAVFGGVNSSVPPVVDPNKRPNYAVELPALRGTEVLFDNNDGVASRMRLTSNLLTTTGHTRMVARILYYSGSGHWERSYLCVL